ncbi:hypothetical protein ACPYO6_08050 [Georgenia sp. Z1344]|uniref:hypothetical protein n=1 Tax=Georgenia sp. Z1344 TaxID=3416706 RepID=UPI003CF7305C
MTRTNVTRFAVFTALMIACQLLGAWLFPDRWTGATNPWVIVGFSLIAGVVYVLVMALLDRRARARR